MESNWMGLDPAILNKLLKDSLMGGMVRNIKRFLDNGGNINFMIDDYWSMLQLAVIKFNVDMVEMLLNYDPDLTIQDQRERRALDLSISYNYSNVIEGYNITRLLLQYGAQVNYLSNNGHSSPFHEASNKNDIPLMELLLEYGANINIGDQHNNTALFQASAGYEPDTLIFLLENGASVNIQNIKGITPLYLAALLHQFDNIDILMDYGADPYINDADGYNVFTRESIKREEKDYILQKVLLQKAEQRMTFMKSSIPRLNNDTPLNQLEDLNIFSKLSEMIDYNPKLQMRKNNLAHENIRMAKYLDTLDQYGSGTRSKKRSKKRRNKRSMKRRDR